MMQMGISPTKKIILPYDFQNTGIFFAAMKENRTRLQISYTAVQYWHNIVHKVD
jgi:hypothetical protein